MILPDLLTNLDSARQVLLSFGPWSGVVFFLLQVAQVFFFFIPGEALQMAGGLVFGLVNGTLLSLLGITAGSLINFFMARKLGELWVKRNSNPKHFGVFYRFLNHPRLEFLLAILFFLPGLPKDFFCYLAGLSRIKAWKFFLISTLARLPSLILSGYLGERMANHDWEFFLIGCLVTLCFLIFAWIFRRKLLSRPPE